MQSLLEFLTAAPKTYVIKLHRKEKPGEGLMQAAKVIQLVHDWAVDPARLRKVLEEAEAPGRYLLGLVYASGDRGAAEEELLNAPEGLQPSQTLPLLGRLEQELLIFSRQGDGPRTYHGFEDYAGLLLPELLAEQWVPAPASETPNWVSYRGFLASHLCHFLCQAALGEIKVTQTGEIHRKDHQELAGRFAFGERLSTAIPSEEVLFLLRFAGQNRLVLQEEGRLHLSDQGKALLDADREEVEAALAEWWMRARAKGMGPFVKAFLDLRAGSPPGASRVAPWANLLWIHGGTQKRSYQDPRSLFTWENLPKALQEMWLLGLVDFGMAKGRLAWLRPSFPAAGTPQGSRPISLPNLESLVPLDSPLPWQSRLELVGRKSNDEFMARYRFTKESVIQGLQAGLTMERFKELLDWLGFEGPACRALLDWASTYASTVFVDSLILKVAEPERFRELEEIPQFLELVTEIIPGYGFALSRANKGRVKELLQHFGLVPGEDARRVPHLEPVSAEAASGWDLQGPPLGPPTYRENPLSLRTAPPPPAEKPQGSREQELTQRIASLEEAISLEKKVEFSLHGPVPRRVVIKPLLVLKQKAPIKLIGIEADTGHRNEYLLEQVKSLRIME